MSIIVAVVLSLLPAGTAEATITVANNGDTGTGSLRQAISEAAPGETIVVPADTYTLTSDELTIEKSLTISGAGAAGTIIRSGGAFRVLDIAGPGTSVTISGVTVRDGHVGNPGGTAEGGGLRNEQASLTLRNVVVTSNHLEVNGTSAGENGGTAIGGGIMSEGGALTLEDSAVSGNSATALGAGSGGNGGVAEGAGLAVFGGTPMTIRNSTFAGNVAEVGGGSGGGNGGIVEGTGLFVGIGSTTAANISANTVSGNRGDASGGSGGNGGIVEGGGMAIDSIAPSVVLSNMTVAGNAGRAPGGSGGNGGIVEGGGLLLLLESGASLTLISATLADNAIEAPGGVAEGGNIFTNAGVKIANSIITGGTGPAGTENCASKLESQGFNLESSNECGFTAVGDQPNTDPLLGPLQDNGGPAQTKMPAANSPAVDHGSAFGLTTDERGEVRPTDLASTPNSSAAGADGSDIGAVELQGPVALRSASLLPPDFDTAIFVPPDTLYLRLKCPARFKPACLGNAVALTSRDHCTRHHGTRRCEHGKPMTNSVSARQKPTEWKVAKLTIKRKYWARVSKMAKHPNKKLLIVRQLIHSTGFKHGSPQAAFHIYRVRTATTP
jgi:hypothetical protein